MIILIENDEIQMIRVRNNNCAMSLCDVLKNMLPSEFWMMTILARYKMVKKRK